MAPRRKARKSTDEAAHDPAAGRTALPLRDGSATALAVLSSVGLQSVGGHGLFNAEVFSGT